MSLQHRLVPHEKHLEKPVSQLEFHPLADLFPMMSQTEFAGLIADIRENGQLEIIVTHEGMILDGRNRYRACQELGVEPKTVEWSGIGSAQSFVVSHNLHRRHLNESQRAMIAGRLSTEKPGGNRKSEKINSDKPELKLHEAAKLMNVGKDSVTNARRVLAEGTQEEIAAVDAGEVSVTLLSEQIRKKVPPEERRARVANPNAARHATQLANGKMWRTFKEALVNLTGLPLPADVVRVVRARDQHNVTNEKLLPALQWLMTFEEAWKAIAEKTKSKGESNGDVARTPLEQDIARSA